MRIARHGPAGRERPIISGADEIWRELTPVIPDVTSALLPLLAAVDPYALPEAVSVAGSALH